MKAGIAAVTIVVRDDDEAIGWYERASGFSLLEDEALRDGKRWIHVARRDGGVALLLARARGDRRQATVGNQTGGRVGFFFQTGDFERDVATMRAADARRRCEFHRQLSRRSVWSGHGLRRPLRRSPGSRRTVRALVNLNRRIACSFSSSS